MSKQDLPWPLPPKTLAANGAHLSVALRLAAAELAKVYTPAARSVVQWLNAHITRTTDSS